MLFMSTTPAEELKELRLKLRFTMNQFAERLGITPTKLQNYEYGKTEPPRELLSKARAITRGDDVSEPKVPAPELRIPIPFIGQVAASTPVDWTDPYEASEMEYVPNEMGDAKGRYCARVVGLSMHPLLLPDDLVIFQSSNIPKLGIVVMHRSNDNQITVKELKHDGKDFILASCNALYPPVIAEGLIVGHLVGIVRHQGLRTTTEYDPSGIRP